MDEERRGRILRNVAVIAAGALAAGAVWNALFDARIVVAEIPPGGNEALFAWWRPVEWQTAGVHLLAIVGFLALAGMGAILGLRLGRSPIGLLGATFLILGGALSAIAHLVQLGGQQAILEASTTSIDPGVLGTIGFTVDRVTAALQLGGYATLGLGVCAVVPSLGSLSARGLSIGVAIVLGAGLFLLAVFTQTDPLDLVGPLTLVLAVVVLPAWAWSVTRVADDASVSSPMPSA